MSEVALYRNALSGGTMLLEYRLESVLGAGGFGMTYLARDVNLDKPVAIKEYFPAAIAVRALDGGVLSTGAEHTEGYQWGLERFLQEARTLARFSHPHIVRVNRYFESNGTGYMVMDYEDGESLYQWLKREPAPNEATVRELLFPLLDGLQAVHQAGFLHRDIKPSNIFLRKNGGPVLLDFGSARAALTDANKTMTSVLTPGYAPLEQYSGEGHQGPWTDIYALGAVLYRVFTGNNPPDAVTRLKNDVVPAKLAALTGRVSQPLLRAAQWAMTLDEKSRPQSVHDWRRALEGNAAAAGAPIASRAAAGAAAVRPVAMQRPAAVARGKSRPPEDISQTWRAVGKGIVVIAILAFAYTWFKNNIIIIDEAAEMEAASMRMQEEALRAAKAERARKAQLPPSMEVRTPEQAALDDREAALREKERRAAEREAALKQQEEARAKEKEPLAAAPTPSATAPLPAAPVPLTVTPLPPPAQSASLQEARLRDPLAAKKEADFRRADTNNDGYLTPDEARDMPGVNRHFSAIDTNADGRVSLEEFFNHRPVKPPPKPF